MKSAEVIRKLAKQGWQTLKKRGKGSHTMMFHPEMSGRVIIPKGELTPGTLKNIEQATGVNLRE